MITFEEIIFKKDILIINNWIKNISDNSNSNVLFIKGNIGTGKTSLCKLIQNKFINKYEFFTYGIDYMNNKNTIVDIINHKNVLSMFSDQFIIKGLIFDNITSISPFIKSLIKLKKKYYKYPIIINVNNDFNFNFNFKYNIIEIKTKNKDKLFEIYSNYKINNKILYNIIGKSNGDFNYINKTLMFIKLSPTIKYEDISSLSKDINMNNYFQLLKFINSKHLILEDYDFNFMVFILKNLYNIINLLKIDYNQKQNFIKYIYNFSLFITDNEYNVIFFLSIKHILNLNKIKNIKYINTVSKSLLLNNNIKSINENVLKKGGIINDIYLHNKIKENKDNKYDKLQKYIQFQYI